MNNDIKILDRRFVPAGHMVIEQGNIGNRAFLIESGKVEVFMRDKKGRIVKIAEVGAGSIIGEMALIDKGQRTASIKTLEDSVLVAISAKDMEESVGDPNGIFSRMMRLMVERLKNTNAELIQQKIALAEIEDAAKLTVQNIGLHIPENRQKQFRHEVVPLLDKLKNTLNKYHQL